MLCTFAVIFVVASVELKTNDRTLGHVLMQIIVFKAALDQQAQMVMDSFAVCSIFCSNV